MMDAGKTVPSPLWIRMDCDLSMFGFCSAVPERAHKRWGFDGSVLNVRRLESSLRLFLSVCNGGVPSERAVWVILVAVAVGRSFCGYG
jgi:hypothetical protein